MTKILRRIPIAARWCLYAATVAPLGGCVPEIVMNSMDHQHYSDYVVQTEKINTTREENHLAPEKIMTFDEWQGRGTST